MLKLLSIANFAVVSQSVIEFGEGLNLITGETGSGKSIVVDALGLLVGGRASGEIVRTGSGAAFVEGVFLVEPNNPVQKLLGEAGIEIVDGEVIVRREISDRSRSRAYVNDRLATLNLLKAMRPFLVDIHGQGDQQTLLSPDAHIDLLDEFGGLGGERARVAALYGSYLEVQSELKQINRSEAERLRDVDMLRFQVDEIEKAALVPEQDGNLPNERLLLANAEKLLQLSADAYALLYEDELAVHPSLIQVEKKVETLARFDQRFQPYLETLQTARYTFEDLAYFLRDYSQDVDFSPDRLAAVDERLVEIERLKRKYGENIDEVLASAAKLKDRLHLLESSEQTVATLTARADSIRVEFIEKAQALSKRRRKIAKELERRVEGELGELAMGETEFHVAFAPAAPGVTRMSGKGVDAVEFLVSTNVGEEPRPLAKIASGGEISRLMLALKTVSAPPEIPRTLVFDEVDVGIGGRVAEAVGSRLARLSSANQVICVTHQAQIARFAEAHFSVEKTVVGERTETTITKLDGTGRIEELARMIGGSDISETARRHARELLAQRP